MGRGAGGKLTAEARKGELYFYVARRLPTAPTSCCTPSPRHSTLHLTNSHVSHPIPEGRSPRVQRCCHLFIFSGMNSMIKLSTCPTNLSSLHAPGTVPEMCHVSGLTKLYPQGAHSQIPGSLFVQPSATQSAYRMLTELLSLVN